MDWSAATGLSDDERQMLVELLHGEAGYRRPRSAIPDAEPEDLFEYQNGWVTEEELHDRVVSARRQYSEAFASGDPFDELARKIDRQGALPAHLGELDMIVEALENKYGAADPPQRPPMEERIYRVCRELARHERQAALLARERELHSQPRTVTGQKPGPDIASSIGF